MTDNEIIKALGCCIDCKCKECPCYKNIEGEMYCTEIDEEEILDLINLQKAEIEKFKSRQRPTGVSGYKIENGKIVFFTNMLGCYRHEYKDLEEVVKTLNELLNEAYSKDEILFHYRIARENLKTAKSEAIKEFAERLKEELMLITANDGGFVPSIIDNLVKEMTEKGGGADA